MTRFAFYAAKIVLLHLKFSPTLTQSSHALLTRKRLEGRQAWLTQ